MIRYNPEVPHICTLATCPEPGRYFVSCINGAKFWLMAGPYPTHQLALDRVDEALKIANNADPRAWFMAWGTVQMPLHNRERGRLHKLKLMPLSYQVPGPLMALMTYDDPEANDAGEFPASPESSI